MGGAVSSGRDNNELIDNLMGGGYIRTRSVERVFRVLDRADYMTPTERDQAYKDLAWRSGALHLSAPCIYSEVMEALELKPGLSFLNLGSGTGYLSTLVGLIIGSAGISHGVEIHPGVVEYSNKKLSQFQENSVTLDEFDFCVPKYYCGNALCLAPLQTLYDRVYVGAGVLDKYENYFKQLIKVEGVLVMPLGDTLVQIQRVSETVWTSRQLLNVSFALLRAPTKEESADPLKLDELVPVSLMVLCRASIRSAMLGGVCRRHPELREPPPRRPPAPRPRPRRICIPLDPDTDDASMNELHDMEGQDGGREMNALLSLVLSMGNNRVAGSLRFDDERADDDDGELEVLIDEMEAGSSSGSESSDAGAVRPSAAGAAGAARRSSVGRAVRRAAVPGARAAATHASAPGQPVPRATPSLTDHCALTPAGRVECDPSVVEKSRPTERDEHADVESDSASDVSKPSTSGESPAASAARRRGEGRGGSGSGGSGGGTKRGSGSGGGGGGGGGAGRVRRRVRLPAASGRRRANPAARSKRYPPEVQIYFGNAGVYAGSDVVQQEEDEAANASAREDRHQPSSSEDDAAHSAKDTKRQKLDSGIGEGTASGSVSSSPPASGSLSASASASASASTSASPDESAATHTDASTTDNQDSGNGRVPRRRRGGYDSESEGSGAAAARRRRSTRDARRVRLSITMKRAVKELPLPYALKKYVNLHRCFEF